MSSLDWLDSMYDRYCQEGYASGRDLTYLYEELAVISNFIDWVKTRVSTPKAIKEVRR